MADKQVNKKARKRKDGQENQPPTKDEPSKEEYAIAKWMRKNVPIKRTKFLSHTVEYFTANKAIDKLMDSPWAQPKKSGEEALFTTRESIVDQLGTMLAHKFFHRARKIAVAESELKGKKKKDKDGKEEKEKEEEKEETPEKEDKSKREETVTAAESSQAEGDKGDAKGDDSKRKKKAESEKKRRKVRLDMHLEQRFVDSSDAYVWIYEPTPYYNYIFGLLVVVAVIGVCLFPLWPSTVRQGVYYLSLAAAGFLVFILALTVIRVLVFGMIWVLTFGRHHFWLLPNLTEDVGFFASFWPLYKYEYKPGDSDDKSKKSHKRKGSDPDVGEQSSNDTKDAPSQTAQGDHSETESEGSQPSQTGKDFEMVDKEEAVEQ